MYPPINEPGKVIINKTAFYNFKLKFQLNMIFCKVIFGICYKRILSMDKIIESQSKHIKISGIQKKLLCCISIGRKFNFPLKFCNRKVEL